MPNTPKIPTDPLHQLADALLSRGRKSLEEIRNAMLDALRPESPLEQRRALEIAGMEVELDAHKRMRDAHLISKTQELAAGVFALGIIKAVPRTQHPEAWEQARNLFSEDVHKQEAARAALAEYGVEPVALFAKAHQALAEALKHHEERITSLEKRRRELLEDFEMLRVRAPRGKRYG